MKKVAFYTLGCKLNFSETSSIGRLFEEKGFDKVAFQDTPDVFVINTCSVTENANKRCRKIVQEALQISPHAFVVVMGCYAQLKPQEIAAIEGVDAVLGANEKFKLMDYIDSFEKQGKAQVHVSAIKEAKKFEHAHSINDRTRTFLKVQDGCNYHCSFCTIPLARGASRSDTIESIVAKAKDIATKNIREIVLTGVNIGDYGIVEGKKTSDFLSLIQALDEVEGIDRFRISSIEPNLLEDAIIDFVAHSKRFVPHFHIPLQSGSNVILEKMRRRYRRELYENRVKHIKSLMPNCSIGVDVIVGFPGETEEEFLNTYQFLNELDITYLHVFPYSERPNTRAIRMEGIVPVGERSKRAKMLRILSEKKQRQFYQTHLGSQATVLFENEESGGNMEGFTENYIRVTAPYDPALCNTLQKVSLQDINPQGLVEVSMKQSASLV